jgi:hypothetical protein
MCKLDVWSVLKHDFSDMENEVLLVINQFHGTASFKRSYRVSEG